MRSLSTTSSPRCFQKACYCFTSPPPPHTPTSTTAQVLTQQDGETKPGSDKKSLDKNNQAGSLTPGSPPVDEGDTFGVEGLPGCLKGCSDFLSLSLSPREQRRGVHIKQHAELKRHLYFEHFLYSGSEEPILCCLGVEWGR